MSIAERITPRQRQMIMFASLTATLMVSLDMTIANVALPEIQGGLAIAPDQLGWVLTSYMIASAIGTPLVGGLVPKLGLRRLYILSVTGFGLASLACGLSTSLGELVFFRAVQGLAGAALNPLSQTLIYDIFPREKLGRAMGLFSMGVMSGAVIGPSVGGFITDVSSWRWIFLVNLPVAIVTVIGLVTFLPSIPRTETRRFDYLGFSFLAVCLFSFQLFLDRGQAESWFESAEIIVEIAIAGTALYMFVMHSLTAKHPFIELALFKDRNFVLATVMNFGIGLVTFIPTIIQPLFQQHVQGYDVLQTGLVMTPRGIGMVAAMFVLSRIADRVDKRALLLTGMLALSWGYWGLSTLTPESPPTLFIWTGVLQAAGMSLTLLPLNLVAFSTLSPELRPMGASLFSLFRGVAIGVGTAISMAYVAGSTEENHVRLMDAISPYNPVMTGAGMPDFWSFNNPISLKLLSLEVWRQASVIAYTNLFIVGIFASLMTAPVLLLMRVPSRKKMEAPHPGPELIESLFQPERSEPGALPRHEEARGEDQSGHEHDRRSRLQIEPCR